MEANHECFKCSNTVQKSYLEGATAGDTSSLLNGPTVHSDVEEREKAVIAFYKTQRTKWASPLHCVLGGKNVSLNF